MEFDRKTNCIKCACGASMEITPQIAGTVLGSVRTIEKANAVRRNAALPRPGSGLRKRLLEMTEEQYRNLLKSVSQGRIVKKKQ